MDSFIYDYNCNISKLCIGED